MSTTRRWLLPAAAIVLLALCLRMAVSGVGVVLDPLRADLSMSAGAAGLLTTLPVLSFAVFGLAAGPFVNRVGLDRAAVLVLAVLAAAMATRVALGSSAAFIVVSAVALAAAAVGNVLLPPLARRHAPGHVSTVSAVYGAAIVGGAALCAALTVPVADLTGSWRSALGWWAAVPVVVLVPWLLVLRRDRTEPEPTVEPEVAEARPQLLRSRTAWVLAAFFGIQSVQAYVQFGWFAPMLTEDGVDDGAAGALLALLAAVGIPIALALPALIRRVGDGVLPWLFGACTVVGWGGMWLTDSAVPVLWAVLLGIGSGAFPWVLGMIPRRAASVSSTAALSATTQGAGYALAAIGPFGVGLLHEATGSFEISLVALSASGVVLTLLGVAVVRSAPVDARQ